MPKIIPAALQAHYDTGQTSLAVGILIQRQGGEVFGLSVSSTPLVLDLTLWNVAPWSLSGLTSFKFDTASGMDALALSSSAGFNTDDGQMIVLNKGTMFDERDILAGRWRGARFKIFLYRWDVSPVTIANDIEVLKTGTLGNIQISPVTLSIELHCLKRRLQQPQGIVSQPTCRSRFGAQGPGECNIDLDPYTHDYTVTTVTDKRIFGSDTAFGPDDMFGNGLVTFTSGLNDGLTMTVEEFAAGMFTLTAPMLRAIQVGDTFTAVEGCRKRFEEDCKARFDNALNFSGEPHRPTRDRVLSGVGQ